MPGIFKLCEEAIGCKRSVDPVRSAAGANEVVSSDYRARRDACFFAATEMELLVDQQR
jgi:hypothetical protein